MHNPFGLFTERLFQALQQSGHTHYVRQTFPRGLDPECRAAFLFTHYNDVNKAQVHYEAIAADANRYIYHVHDPADYRKLQTAATQPAGFRIYAPLLEKPWKPQGQMADKIRQYITEQLNWSPARSDKVKAELFTQFGELFITLKYRAQECKVPLGEIEKY